MIVLYALAHGVARPTYTRDADLLVDIRTLASREVARFLTEQGFDLEWISPDGVGHRFVRGSLKIDVLAVDHVGSRVDRTTVPPARTVPGGRQAMSHIDTARIITAERSGDVPVPDWTGALILKSRAALSFIEARDKHLQDIALLLGLPVDVADIVRRLRPGERKHIRRAVSLLDDGTWRAVSAAVDERIGRAAAAILTAS